MSDPTALASALGIEGMHWVTEDEHRLRLSVNGRWRRRRPGWAGQPMLLVEAHGVRHRFPALPEPPSLTGAPPGGWRLSFSVPAGLGPFLAHAQLQLGATTVPLGSVAQTGPAAPASGPAAGTLPGPSPPRAPLPATAPEPPLTSAAADLARRLVELEERLREARASLERTQSARREAEQREHAERALREELEERLLASERQRTAPLELVQEMRRTEQQVQALEHEVEWLRAQLRRAEHEGAATSSGQLLALRREAGLVQQLPRALAAGGGDSSRAPVLPRAPVSLVHERAVVDGHRMGNSEGELERILEQLRAELDALHAALAQRDAELAQAHRREAELRGLLERQVEHSRRAQEAIGAVRALLAELRRPPAGDEVDPERLTAALARLREAAPRTDAQRVESHADQGPEAEADADAEAEAEPKPAPVSPSPPAPRASRGPAPPSLQTHSRWLRRLLARFAREDAGRAGQLLLGLLAVQGAVHPEPIAYDLVLADNECIRVTVREGRTLVERSARPREREQTSFRLMGSEAQVARLLLAGRIRRRLSSQMPKVQGDRRAVSVLDDLVRARLSLADLHRAGMRLPAELAMRMVAALVDPAWTAGARFVLAHREAEPGTPCVYIQIRDGARPVVGHAPLPSEAIATIVSPGELLAGVLAGESSAEVEVLGDPRALELVQNWLELAQSA